MELLFRSLVVSTAVLNALFWALPYLDRIWLSSKHLELLGQNGLGAVIPSNASVYWGTLLVWVALSIGLFFYKRIARTAFIIFMLVSIALSPFYGVQVLTAYEATLQGLIGLVDGAIIAMSYLTAVSGRFTSRA